MTNSTLKMETRGQAKDEMQMASAPLPSATKDETEMDSSFCVLPVLALKGGDDEEDEDGGICCCCKKVKKLCCGILKNFC